MRQALTHDGNACHFLASNKFSQKTSNKIAMNMCPHCVEVILSDFLRTDDEDMRQAPSDLLAKMVSG